MYLDTGDVVTVEYDRAQFYGPSCDPYCQRRAVWFMDGERRHDGVRPRVRAKLFSGSVPEFLLTYKRQGGPV